MIRRSVVTWVLFCFAWFLPLHEFTAWAHNAGDGPLWLGEPALHVQGDGQDPVSGVGGEPVVSADAAVLMDAATGQILYSKNPHQPRPPASTTKIVTALIAMEAGRLDRMVTVSPGAAMVGESSLYLKAGERLSLRQLIYGALLKSGNDACVAIAEHVAGSEGNFVRIMNERAQILGARNTFFVNTNGLPASGHRTTAYDLALLARYAMQIPEFNKVVRTKYAEIDGDPADRYLSNTNKMLWSYEGADGVKTGTTVAAGKCLVASATRDGRRLISVVLHSDERYDDSIRLLDYGFNCFDSVTVVLEGEVYATGLVEDGVSRGIPLASDRDIVLSLPRDRTDLLQNVLCIDKNLIAPVHQREYAGRIKVLVGGEPVSEAILYTTAEVQRLPLHRLFMKNLAAGQGI